MEGGVRRFIAAQIALVQQADGEFEVTFVDLATFGGRVNGVANAQAAIPQALKELSDALDRSWGEQQQIDVGVRKKLAASVSADGDHRHSRLDAGVRFGYDSVDLGGPLNEGRLHN